MNSNYRFILDGKVIDSASKIIRCEETRRILGCLPRNYRDILHYLYDNPNDVISKAELADIGWQGKNVKLSSVVVAISEIRGLMGQDVILTIHNEGYVLNV
ncbi:helix-turn-helix domain-containing protein [Vibrio sp. SCSIO 43140]|uniref:winged helix-turn-helix domain-containing protein n=1 Tax=Vibrio sp. SCSIO 43140 TaxID=2819100 RepID=UPI002075FAF0|nr:helix-turn-helix domain-containing protein [Vibrio sp. SCSIO 43140]USD63668.1 helix-turn-helix domain-containing protein [Vibrio sp. SCSIO 43140]